MPAQSHAATEPAISFACSCTTSQVMCCLVLNWIARLADDLQPEGLTMVAGAAARRRFGCHKRSNGPGAQHAKSCQLAAVYLAHAQLMHDASKGCESSQMWSIALSSAAIDDQSLI